MRDRLDAVKASACGEHRSRRRRGTAGGLARDEGARNEAARGRFNDQRCIVAAQPARESEGTRHRIAQTSVHDAARRGGAAVRERRDGAQRDPHNPGGQRQRRVTQPLNNHRDGPSSIESVLHCGSFATAAARVARRDRFEVAQRADDAAHARRHLLQLGRRRGVVGVRPAKRLHHRAGRFCVQQRGNNARRRACVVHRLEGAAQDRTERAARVGLEHTAVGVDRHGVHEPNGRGAAAGERARRRGGDAHDGRDAAARRNLHGAVALRVSENRGERGGGGVGLAELRRRGGAAHVEEAGERAARVASEFAQRRRGERGGAGRRRGGAPREDRGNDADRATARDELVDGDGDVALLARGRAAAPLAHAGEKAQRVAEQRDRIVRASHLEGADGERAERRVGSPRRGRALSDGRERAAPVDEHRGVAEVERGGGEDGDDGVRGAHLDEREGAVGAARQGRRGTPRVAEHGAARGVRPHCGAHRGGGVARRGEGHRRRRAELVVGLRVGDRREDGAPDALHTRRTAVLRERGVDLFREAGLHELERGAPRVRAAAAAHLRRRVERGGDDAGVAAVLRHRRSNEAVRVRVAERLAHRAVLDPARDTAQRRAAVPLQLAVARMVAHHLGDGRRAALADDAQRHLLLRPRAARQRGEGDARRPLHLPSLQRPRSAAPRVDAAAEDGRDGEAARVALDQLRRVARAPRRQRHYRA